MANVQEFSQRLSPKALSSMSNSADDDGGVAVGEESTTHPVPTRPRPGRMPLWKVLLHNDNHNEMGYVVETIIELTTLRPQVALVRMLEAHQRGVSLLVTTHREYAELLQERFASKGLMVTIEPDR